MAITYSSWEYSQGPTLYIDSSGFESIDDDKIVLIAHSDEQKEVIGKRFNDLLFYTFEYVTKKERKIEDIINRNLSQASFLNFQVLTIPYSYLRRN